MKSWLLNSNIYQNKRGVALLAVLAVLTVLAIMAAAFGFYMNLEQQTGALSVAKVQADLLAQSALEHAVGELSSDINEQPAWDYYDEPWTTSFSPQQAKPEDDVDIDGLPSSDKDTTGTKDARWIYVRNDKQQVVGRYAVLVEDESSKINANVASALSSKYQNQGFGTFETLLTDGRQKGLPLSLSFGKKIMDYRYGRDEQPGQAQVDDNLTASSYAADEIDNDADSIYDEYGEGTDEQDEYNPLAPHWDDRSFSSIQEMLDVCQPKGKTSLAQQRFLKKYATIYTRSRDMYYDERDNKLHRQINLNVASRDQIRKLLRRANEESRFEPSSKNMRTLIANLMDYRDQNHVLTTIESEYGVEAVCFNEIMAHDGSWIRETDWSGWGFPGATGEDARYHVLCYNYYYGRFQGNPAGEQVYRFRFKNVSKAGSRGGKTLVRIRLDRPRRDSLRLAEFLACDQRWPKNFWYNGTVIVYNLTKAAYEGFPVAESPATSQREIIAAVPPSKVDFVFEAASNHNSTVTLWTHWRHGGAMWCEYPEQSETYFFKPPVESLEKYYYQVYNANQSFTYIDGKSFVREMDMDGDPGKYSVQNELKSDNGNYSLKYPYKGGDAVRPNSVGYIPVTITSSRKCKPSNRGDAGKYVNFSDAMSFIRPDIVELINISEQPISLKNWGVVVNTGLRAEKLAVIDNAVCFNKRLSRRFENPNPVIEPNGYFYLTNNREIFDREYCDGNGEYGSSNSEQIPVFELPTENWGILYDVVKLAGDFITVSGSSWTEDQLLGELVQFVSDRTPTAKHDPPNGVIKYIWGNNANTLTMGGSDPIGTGLEVGDQVRIMGLPRQGGFVSFTLKNEYGQVAARTTEYGSVDENEYGFSTEKFDPTHYTWNKLDKPTIGGMERDARSKIMKTSAVVKPYVKNNRFATVAEIQKVRKASDWENIGLKRGGSTSEKILKAITKYFTVSGTRLDPEEEGAHVLGWNPAFGKVNATKGNTLVCSDANWESGIWRGQTLRILSGGQKSEEYSISDNQQNSVLVEGYSVPGERELRAKVGDEFSVGPGYSTPMYYTRKDSEEGVWEWKDKGLERMEYGLYIFGLNDSIDTTEFLEENHNASIEVAVFNYDTHEYDTIPLQGERTSSRGADDAYTIVRGINWHQCDKMDGFYCGQIHPCHISPDGGVKIKLIPHNLQGEMNSGFAWFDYAFLAPGVVNGKININTAPYRVLAALNGVTPEQARSIERGADNNGRAVLKPYRNITDVLDVRGIDPDTFGKICNLITTRSDQFRIQVLAETINDSDSDGKFTAADKVLAHTSLDVILDRQDLSDDDPETTRIKLLSRQ